MKTLIFFIAVAALAGAAFFFFLNNYSQPAITAYKNTKPNVLATKVPEQPLQIIGWTAYWDEQTALEHLENAAPKLTVFSPILYQIKSDGTLETLEVNTRDQMLSVAEENNIPIYPVIGDNFDHNRVYRLLNNQEIQQKFIDEMIIEARDNHYSGWSIDIETLKKSDREAFTAFVKNVSIQLKEYNLPLSMILYAKDEKETLEEAVTQDYKSIGEYADHVILMTYGYHNDSTEEGAQAPLSWYKNVLSYTLKNVPKEKIVIGLTTHGYDWGELETEPLTYQQIAKIIETHNATVTYDEDNSSAVTTYNNESGKHTIWYEDAKTMKEKIDIARQEFGISSFAIWRIGAEDREFWNTLEDK